MGERRVLAEADQERDLGDRQVGRGEVAVRRLPAHLVEELRERGAFGSEPALQGPGCSARSLAMSAIVGDDVRSDSAMASLTWAAG